MIERRASCHCGAFSAVARGEPVRVSICHCNACRRRTGSVFSYNSTWLETQVEANGASASFRRCSDDGFWVESDFCTGCGSTVICRIEQRPGMVTIPVGAFADPNFPKPTVSVYDERRHSWCAPATGQPLELE